jgi:hypothetical protein
VGLWAELIEVVEFDSKWTMIHYLGSPQPGVTANLEIGIGGLGAEVRKWKSFASFISGSGLEFDDTGITRYIPFNFKKDDRVSGRIAGISANFGVAWEIQLQIFS